ncbi:MAG: hypothetical protein PHW34_14395 [Hespellia sp.]|nr:hypothetical protein [Hespellia sp.]
MKNKGKIAFIVEGPVKEQQIFQNIKKNFFANTQIEIISIPAKQNLYMLWNTLKTDDFQTDILEIIKEYYKRETHEEMNFLSADFQEIYLFFDYDGHQNNLPAEVDPDLALNQMLETFDNETELGKLYVSYPMVEAIKDLQSEEKCRAFERCEVPITKIGEYKRTLGKNISYNQIKKYDKEWNAIIKVFVSRIRCMLNLDEQITFEVYRERIDPQKIYEIQRKKYVVKKKCIFVLSAFPEFLLDYFPKDFWTTYIS